MFTKNAIHKYMDYDEQHAKSLDLQSIRQACCFDPRWMFTILWRTWIVLHICLMFPKTKQQSKVLQSDNSYHKEFALVKGAEPFLQHDRDLLQDSQLWEVFVFQLPRKLRNKVTSTWTKEQPCGAISSSCKEQSERVKHRCHVMWTLPLSIKECESSKQGMSHLWMILSNYASDRPLFVYKQTHNHKTLSYEKVTIFYRFQRKMNEIGEKMYQGQNKPSHQAIPRNRFQVIHPFLQSHLCFGKKAPK